MNFIEELGLDPEDFEWNDLALCQGMPTTMFYDDYEKDVEVAKQVDQVCLSCPVIAQCFFKGSEGNFGVWGGIYWNGAGKPDRNKNSHKTDEVNDEIRDKVSQ
jgi:hypothetical protein